MEKYSVYYSTPRTGTRHMFVYAEDKEGAKDECIAKCYMSVGVGHSNVDPIIIEILQTKSS